MSDYQRWRAALAEANDPAFYTLDYQDWLIGTDQGQFWGDPGGAIITWLKRYPGGAVTCETYAAAGDPAVWVEILKPRIEAWAAAMGCSDCLITAKRRGMAKLHPDYEHVQTILRKSLV